jgi:hypothetical protein
VTNGLNQRDLLTANNREYCNVAWPTSVLAAGPIRFGACTSAFLRRRVDASSQGLLKRKANATTKAARGMAAKPSHNLCSRSIQRRFVSDL